MPVFARDILHVGSAASVFCKAPPAPAPWSALLVAWFCRTPAAQVLQTAIGATLFGILLMPSRYLGLYTLSLALVFALGLTSQFYMTSVNQTLQMNLPDQLRGRVMGISGLAWELTPIGGTIRRRHRGIRRRAGRRRLSAALWLPAGRAVAIVLSKAKHAPFGRQLDAAALSQSRQALIPWLRKNSKENPARRANGASSPASPSD